MITETNLLKENKKKFRKWLDATSRGNKQEYKNHLADVLEFWLDEKLHDISVGNIFRFEGKDVSEFLQVARKIYEHPSYKGKNGIDWKDHHNAPSAAISNYYKYLGFETNWKKDIYATDPFGIKKAYIEKKFDREIQKEDGDFMPKCTMQTIFFGAPGTGKSHKIDYNLFKDKEGNLIGKGIKEIPEDRKFRTTFHPDYDYAQFVGAYKPKKEGDAITYSFVPQVFAKAYATAWKLYLDAKGDSRLRGNDDKNGENDSGKDIQVYLVIEEINRGNCAQIFGDIFQLLDRDSEGFSQYSIDADCDFAEWLKDNGVGDGKLKLPPNLNILATMNTSDQSLFPMDSAFKRRFDWEYVPISFDGKDAANYQIDIDGSQYSWQNFVEAVNDKILDLTESEDKQLGEFFIKPDNGNIISKERFLGKVMFYLWNEVCKDEHKNGSFFRAKINDKEDFFTFQDLYKKKDLLKLFMDELLKKE